MAKRPTPKKRTAAYKTKQRYNTGFACKAVKKLEGKYMRAKNIEKKHGTNEGKSKKSITKVKA